MTVDDLVNRFPEGVIAQLPREVLIAAIEETKAEMGPLDDPELADAAVYLAAFKAI